jgi:integrase
MRWESVDLQNKWIAFRAGKTKQRLKLPMPEALHEFLLELPAPDSGKEFLFPSLAGKRTGGITGLSMAFKRIMERACVRGEVARERKGEKGRTVNTLTFHSFRHTLNSILANAGVPVEVRQKFTGHASAAMNQHYTHHEIATLRAAVEKQRSRDLFGKKELLGRRPAPEPTPPSPGGETVSAKDALAKLPLL